MLRLDYASADKELSTGIEPASTKMVALPLSYESEVCSTWPRDDASVGLVRDNSRTSEITIRRLWPKPQPAHRVAMGPPGCNSNHQRCDVRSYGVGTLGEFSLG